MSGILLFLSTSSYGNSWEALPREKKGAGEKKKRYDELIAATYGANQKSFFFVEKRYRSRLNDKLESKLMTHSF